MISALTLVLHNCRTAFVHSYNNLNSLEYFSNKAMEISTLFSSFLFLVCTGAVLMEESELSSTSVDNAQNDRSERKLDFAAEAFRRRLQQASGGSRILSGAQDRDVEDFRRRLNQQLNLPEWNQFTPPPVVEPDCHVELKVTNYVPGRCIKLGGHIPACQSEEYLEIDYKECN